MYIYEIDYAYKETFFMIFFYLKYSIQPLLIYFFSAFQSRSIVGIFSMLANLVVPMLQVIFFVPALASLVSSYPSLIIKTHHSLKKPWLFMITTVGYISSCSLNITLILKYYNEISLEVVSTVIFVILFNTATFFSAFIIGTCLEQVCQDIMTSKMAKNISTDMINDFSQEFKGLKMGLSPLLFLTFLVKCILLISMVLTIAAPSTAVTGTELYYICYVLSYGWDLFYITVAVEETMDIFKSLILQLR